MTAKKTNRSGDSTPSIAPPEIDAPDDSARLTWLIATGAYGLIDHDAYAFVDDLQATVRQKIDEYMQAHNGLISHAVKDDAND